MALGPGIPETNGVAAVDSRHRCAAAERLFTLRHICAGYIAAGNTATITVSVVGGTAPVDLSYDPTSWPAIMAEFGSFTLNPGGSTTVTLKVLNTATPGSYSLAISGTNGVLTQTSQFNIVVGSPPPPYPHLSGCSAAVYGLSEITADPSSGAVSGYGSTEVNYCASNFGYAPGIRSGLFKGSDDYTVSAYPSDGSVRIDLQNYVVEAYVSSISGDGDVYELISDHYVAQIEFIWVYDVYGNYISEDPLGLSMLPGNDGTSGGAWENDEYDETGLDAPTLSISMSCS